MENLFKFKTEEKFKHRHTDSISGIKFLFQQRNLGKLAVA